MSYLTPFILLYIIDQHKPKPLDNPEKNLIIFRNPAGWGVSEKCPAVFFCLPPEGGGVGDAVALNPSLLAPVPSWVFQNSLCRSQSHTYMSAGWSS